MKALRNVTHEGPSGLKLADVPEPAMGPSDIRVKVRSSALNRADLYQTQGEYPAPPDAPQDIPGLEYAGEVIEVGARAKRFQVGDRVMGLVGGGAWAEQLVVQEREAIPVPQGVSLEDAGAIPEAFLTAFDAVRVQALLAPSEWLLIHAVASGVGTAGVQLAAAMGARVIGTARTQEKLDRVKSLGIEHALCLRDTPPTFAKEIVSRTGGAHVAMDLVGGPYLTETLGAMARRGRVVCVGSMAGSHADVGLGHLMGKRLTVIGTVMRSRPLEEKATVARAFERELLPLFASRKLRPLVDARFPMADARAALERMARNESVGKLVLAWP